MDYAKLITKSLQTAWKYKYLWLFGFFLEILDNKGNFRYTRHHWNIDPAVLIAIVFTALFLFLIFWLISILSEGSLVHGVSRIEFGKKTNLSDCFSAGLSYFPKIFGIKLLAAIAVIAVILGSLLFMVPVFLAAAGLGLVVAIFMIPFMIVLSFMIISIEAWSVRYVVLQKKSWTEGLEYGWHMLKTNVGKTIGVALSSVLVKIITVIGVLICMAFLAIPFVLMGLANLWMGLIPGIIVGSFILILLTGYMGVYSSSLWTYAFMQITDYAPEGAEAKEGEARSLELKAEAKQTDVIMPVSAPQKKPASGPKPASEKKADKKPKSASRSKLKTDPETAADPEIKTKAKSKPEGGDKKSP